MSSDWANEITPEPRWTVASTDINNREAPGDAFGGSRAGESGDPALPETLRRKGETTDPSQVVQPLLLGVCHHPNSRFHLHLLCTRPKPVQIPSASAVGPSREKLVNPKTKKNTSVGELSKRELGHGTSGLEMSVASLPTKAGELPGPRLGWGTFDASTNCPPGDGDCWARVKKCRAGAKPARKSDIRRE